MCDTDKKIKQKKKKQGNKDKTFKSLAYKKKNYLTLLGNTSKKRKRDLLIDYGEKDDIQAICECIHNVLQGKITLPKRKLGLLKKHRKCLRSLTSGGLSLKSKKNSLKQRGGFLSVLLPAAISAIASIAGGAA